MLTTFFFLQLIVHRSSSRANSCLIICTLVCLHVWGWRSPCTISSPPNRRRLSYVIVLWGYSRQQSAAPGYPRHWCWQCQVTITNKYESETHVETLEIPFKSNTNCILALRPAVLFSWLFFISKTQSVRYSGNISSCSFQISAEGPSPDKMTNWWKIISAVPGGYHKRLVNCCHVSITLFKNCNPVGNRSFTECM